MAAFFPNLPVGRTFADTPLYSKIDIIELKKKAHVRVVLRQNGEKRAICIIRNIDTSITN